MEIIFLFFSKLRSCVRRNRQSEIWKLAHQTIQDVKLTRTGLSQQKTDTDKFKKVSSSTMVKIAEQFLMWI